MLRSDYCLARAERLRMLMLTAFDPAVAVRLRGLVQKYRTLAEHARKTVRSPLLVKKPRHGPNSSDNQAPRAAFA